MKRAGSISSFILQIHGLVLSLILFCGAVKAQTIVKFEYFIDVDPGMGLGIPQPTTPSATITNFPISISTTTMTTGYHTVFFRAQQASGEWTASTFFSIFIVPTPVPPATTVLQIEYFIDADPGEGSGTPVTGFSPSGTVTNVPISLNIASLATGYHTISVRAKNEQGAWTQVTFFSFFIVPTPVPPAATVQQIEYFIDADPGIGSGTQVTGFSPSATISNLPIAFNTSSLTTGFHTLYVRAKNEKGEWTAATWYKFYISPVITPTNLVKFEYFFDTDPGVGAGTAVAITPPSSSVTGQTIFALPSSLSVGDHVVFVRAKDAAGDWTEVVSQTFSVVAPSCTAGNPAVTGGTGCVNTSITLTAAGATGTQQYRWYDAATGGNLLSSSPTYSPVVSATTTFYASIFDPTQNCESPRSSVDAAVTPAPEAPTVTASGATAFCSNATLTLSGPSGYSAYLWSDGNTNQSRTVTSSVSLSLQVKDATGCLSPSSDPVAVTVYPVPSKPVVTGSTDVCNGNTAVLSGPAGYSYTWSDDEMTQQISVTQQGSFTLTITDEHNCQATSDAVLVGCTDSPPAIAAPTITTSVGGTVTFPILSVITDPENNLDKSSIKVSGQPESGAMASIDNEYNLVVSYKGILFAGTDHLKVTACDLDARCTESEIAIEVAGDITVYQGVSPNGDNANDVFFIQYIELLPDTKNNKVTIFNRWGDIVFDISNYDNTSNVFRGVGNNGDKLPAGTYFYRIDFASDKKAMTGYLSLKN